VLISLRCIFCIWTDYGIFSHFYCSCAKWPDFNLWFKISSLLAIFEPHFKPFVFTTVHAENGCISAFSDVVCRYIQLLGIVPTDAVIEKRLGEMFDSEGDKTEALTYYYNVCTIQVTRLLTAFFI